MNSTFFSDPLINSELNCYWFPGFNPFVSALRILDKKKRLCNPFHICLLAWHCNNNFTQSNKKSRMASNLFLY